MKLKIILYTEFEPKTKIKRSSRIINGILVSGKFVLNKLYKKRTIVLQQSLVKCIRNNIKLYNIHYPFENKSIVR